MAPAALLNVRSALHMKTVIGYFSVTALRSNSKWEFEEHNQLTPLRMWSDLNDCSYIRMHSWWIDSSFHTEMKSPALPRAERENYNALGCSTKLPVLGRIQMEAMFASFWKERASFSLKLPKRIVHWNSEHTDVGNTASTGLRLQWYSWHQEEYEQSSLPGEH